jgi:hypothetical protein
MATSWKVVAGVMALWGIPIATGAQHLIWKPRPATEKITCLYGEIQVLATGPTTYYCGCNWWPGSPAGGYTGIQDAGNGRRLMIFSVWDTSATLHPSTTAADPRTQYSRFGGEGEGAHTNLDYHWKIGETYRYYVTKVQDATGANTLVNSYFYDANRKKWVHEATIASPNDGHESVATFGGMLNSFLENWAGQEPRTPRLALYRLWLGTSPKHMANVTQASGDGNWGVLKDTFYLAAGDDQALAPILTAAEKGGARAIRGKTDHSTLTVHRRNLPGSVLRALEHLPAAPPVK